MAKEILLVEDEAIIAIAEIMELEKKGYIVHHVTTGEKAVQAIIDDVLPVDLILMDIDLGSGIDGTQAAEQILTHKDIPVVFLSSHTEPEVVEKTEKITSYGYVVKNSGIVVIDTSIKMAFKLFDAKIAHKQKEEELRKSDYKYRMLFENMNVSFALHEMIYNENGNPVDYRFLDMNPMFLDNLGCTDSTVRGHTAKELFPNTEQYWIDIFGEVAKTGESVAFQNYSRELNQWFNAFVFSPQKNQFASFFIDITEQKKAEEELRKFKTISDNAVYGNAIADLKGNLVYINRFFANIHGYEPEDLIGKNLSLFHNQEQIEAVERLNASLMQEGNFEPTTVWHCHKDGTEFPMLMSGILLKDDYGNPQYMASSAVDITSQMQTEENYRLLFNYSNDAIFVHEIGEDKLPGRIIEVNEQVCRLLKYSREELLQKSIKDISAEKNQSLMLSRAQELIENKHLTFESEDVRSDGVVIQVEVSAYTYNESGKQYVVSSVRDISERKQTENALREKTEMLNNVIENISDLVLLADVSAYITYHSDLYETLGYGQNSLIGRNVLEFVHPEDLPEIESNFTEFINNREDKRRVEYRFRCANGNYVWLETDGKTIKDEEANIKEVLFSARDITDRKKTQDAIKESEKKYRLITENASDIIIQVDEQLKPTYISPSVTEYFGYTFEDVGERSMLEFVHPTDRKKIEKMIEERANKELKQFTQTLQVFTKWGEIRWLETNVNHLHDEKGQSTGELYVARDITNIRKLEKLNKERSVYLEAILEATPNAIITFDSQNKINEWNKGAEKLFNYTKEEVLDQDIDKIVGGEDDIVYEEALSFSQHTLSGETVPPTETIRFTKEREPLSVIVAGSPIVIDGTFTGVVATYTDISRLKNKEKEVETLLEEKEHLLHEVHHRIKNHMSTISSIISLRASHIDNPQIRDVLEEVQSKVNLMRNIYQHLYTGEDVGTIRISSYLGPVLNDIQYAYIDSRSISISTDIEEIEVASKQSFPVGIIITELITNSIKYAFDESGEGKIHVSIHRDKEHTGFLCIGVSDNGKGMPPKIVENGEYGFGLTLVEGYTKQFDGTMSISTEEGTRVRVVLELE